MNSKVSINEAKFLHQRGIMRDKVTQLAALSRKSHSLNSIQLAETISKTGFKKFTDGNLMLLAQTVKLLSMSVYCLNSIIHQSDYSFLTFNAAKSVACWPLEIRLGSKMLETKEFMDALTLWEQTLGDVHTRIQISDRFPALEKTATAASCSGYEGGSELTQGDSLEYLLALNYWGMMRQVLNSDVSHTTWRRMITVIMDNWLWTAMFIQSTRKPLDSISEQTQRRLSMHSFMEAETFGSAPSCSMT